ncbi:lamin tail domain-containing protein [Candidatus Woesearchaeota archaeon]|nr:lamin tail domain-containing protein [Candidatus Woesearchaeota archaeon]MBW3005596.1 lamin tail domain-containing protein [Candidatus Woesearchaeota archaeon]
MNKTILTILLMLIILPNFVSAVYINQVFYDPETSETSSEAIELHNPSASAIDIGRWIIATETSAKDAVIPANSIIKAKGYYLVADTGWNNSKNSGWRDADHTETITMNNDNSGVALKDSNGTVIDAVGWGSASGIKNNLFEGSPAVDVKEGKVLLRKKDSNNNSADFVEAVPDFSDPDSIKIVVNVTNSTGNVSSVTLDVDDDSSKKGTQIRPVSGGKRKVRIVAVASDEVSATFLNQTIVLNNTHNDTYEGFVELEHDLSPGNYSINVAGSKLFFEYLELLDFTVTSNKIQFSTLPGKEAVAKTNAVVKNTGNVDLNLYLEANDLVFDDSKISADNLKISSDNENFGDLDETFVLNPGEELSLYFSLFVPAKTSLGNYHSIVSLKAEKI